MLESENKIISKIDSFIDLIDNDENHRYKSWEHCYSYFTKPKEDIEIDKACLHLAFYLASWGMYRGSTFLFWKDYLIHWETVEEILRFKHLQNINFLEEYKTKEIFSLIQTLKDKYKNKIKSVNGIEKEIIVSDTLVTKILLGTLGCVPAYDRFFLKGLKKSNIKPYSYINERNFIHVVDFYRLHQSEFNSINLSTGIKYPTMKLIDMYMWQIGFEAEKEYKDNLNENEM
jgi:hypothetical protein